MRSDAHNWHILDRRTLPEESENLESFGAGQVLASSWRLSAVNVPEHVQSRLQPENRIT